MFLIQILKKKGLSKQSLSHFEDIGGCVARLVLNKHIGKQIEAVCDNEKQQFEQDIDYIITTSETSLEKSNLASVKLHATK